MLNKHSSQPLINSQKNNAEKLLPIIGLITCSLLILVFDEVFTDFLETRHLIWMIWLEYRPDRPHIAYLSFLFAFIWVVIYCWAAFRASHPVRIILTIFFGLAVFVEYGYFLTFHRLMSALDFWTAVLSPWSLWTEAIGMYINWNALAIFLLFLIGVVSNWRKPRSRWLPEVILVVFVTSSLFLQGNSLIDAKMGSSIFKFTQLIGKIRLSDQLFANREEISKIEHNPPENNIVLVIDESLRGDHLSINGYSRDTTPSLRNLMEKGFINNWKIAVASATCSSSSNPQIITGVLPRTDDHRFVSSWPTIFQYARAMGYRTYYLDAQEEYLWNGLTPGDKKYIDIWKNAKDFGENNLADQQAAQYIWQEIHNSTGNFIVLNKRGMHIKYENTYPAEKGTWLPTPPGRDYRKYPLLVRNVYDNAVHYNLETFFQTLLPEGKPLPHMILLYTSDHGETLQENGEVWSHCHDTSPEATVPLFLIGETEYKPDTNYQASHSNIFPTVLDLMNVPEDSRVKPYNYSLFKANTSLNKERYFLDGDLIPVKFVSFPP